MSFLSPSKRKILTTTIIIPAWFIYSGISTACKEIYKEELYNIFVTSEYKEEIKEPSTDYAKAISKINTSPSAINRAIKISYIKIVFDFILLSTLAYFGACLIHRVRIPEGV